MVQYNKVLAFLALVNDATASEVERGGDGSGVRWREYKYKQTLSLNEKNGKW